MNVAELHSLDPISSTVPIPWKLSTSFLWKRKRKGIRNGDGQANPRWCGKETWHVMKVEIRVTYWMISLEYLSLCVSQAHNEGGGRDVVERAQCQLCRWTLWAHFAACHLWLERSTLFAPAESGDVLLGNFMDSHHSHSHHPLWVLGYWGALLVMWVAEHLRKTVEPIPWPGSWGNSQHSFCLLLWSANLHCFLAHGQHMEWNTFQTLCHLARSLISLYLSFLKCLMGISPFPPYSHFFPCPLTFSDQLFLCCLKTIRKESEMNPGDSRVILIFWHTVASSMEPESYSTEL